MLLETSLPGQKNNEDHVSNVEYHTECVTQKNVIDRLDLDGSNNIRL
jgi:hypothetical protein